MELKEDKWKGVIISESLKEPSLINNFKVYRAEISREELNVDYNGGKGRWHLYWVYAVEEQFEKLKSQLKKGWYAHFWKGDKLIAVFQNKIFRFTSDNSTWKKVLEYGISIGIPKEQLDFPIG